MRQRKKLLPGDVVTIRWVDSTTMRPTWWHTSEVYDEPQEIKSIGFVAKNNEEVLALAVSRDVGCANPQYGPVSIIPWVSIKSLRVVRIRT